MFAQALCVVGLVGLALAGSSAARTNSKQITKPEQSQVGVELGRASGTTSKSVSFIQTTTLAEFGETKMQLEGDGALRNFYIGVRSDHSIATAKLILQYKASPSLLPKLSHLQVRLNQQLVAQLPVQGSSDGERPTQAVINLDPRLFVEDNWLTFHLVGHYTIQDCEDPQHSSIWLDIDTSRSKIELQQVREHLVQDLVHLPNPWLDKRDKNKLNVSIVTDSRPEQATLQATAKLASWLGAQAGGRHVKFNFFRNKLPQGHAIVLASGATAVIDGWNLPEVAQPTVRILELPADKNAKVLLIQGVSGEELDRAVTGMVLSQKSLTGSVAAFNGPITVVPRTPYDSPNWIQTNKPIRVSQLLDNPNALNLAGKHESVVRMQMRLAPDLWNGPGARGSFRLRFKANSSDAELQNDRMSLVLNGALIQNWRLPAAKLGSGGFLDRSLGRMLGNLTESYVETSIDYLLPGEMNVLEIAIPMGVKPGGGRCESMLQRTFASIHPESHLDLTALPHYKAMPDLKSFRETGFPFTRMADLSDTVVVLPKNPENAHIEAMLSVMGNMGRWSSVAATGVRVTDPDQLSALKDKDVVWISTGTLDPSIAPWMSKLTLTNKFTGGQDNVGGAWSSWVRKLKWFTAGNQNTALDVSLSGPVAIIAGLESPWTPQRSMVVLYGSASSALQSLVDAFDTPARAFRISGALVVLRSDEVDVIDSRTTYYTGKLSFFSWLGMTLDEYPLLMVVTLAVSVLGAMVYAARYVIRRMQVSLGSRRTM